MRARLRDVVHSLFDLSFFLLLPVAPGAACLSGGTLTNAFGPLTGVQHDFARQILDSAALTRAACSLGDAPACRCLEGGEWGMEG